MVKFSDISRFKKTLELKRSIEEEDISFIRDVRDEIAELESKLEIAKNLRDQKEAEIYLSLKSGARIGDIPWVIDPQIVFRTYPAWKDLVLDRLGVRVAKAFIEKTKKTKYLDLKILEKGDATVRTIKKISDFD